MLLHLPEPIGWVALTPDDLREAQQRARDVMGSPNAVDEAASRAQQADLVDADQLARVLGVKATWVLRKARRREIPFVMAGKYRRFSVEDVRSALAREARK